MSEASESDCDVESSEEDLQMVESKKISEMHGDESSDDGIEERKGPAKFNKMKVVQKKSKEKKGEITVDF